MKTLFEMKENLKNEFIKFSKNKIQINSIKPYRFIEKMKKNTGNLGLYSPYGIDEKGLERKNPVISVLGDSVTAGHFEWIIDPEKIFTKIKEAELSESTSDLKNGPLEITDVREVYHERFRIKLIDKYEQTSVSVINAGIAGDDILGMERRLSRDVINYQPDLVIINGSLNWTSVKGSVLVFQEALYRIVRRIKAETDADIILMTPNAEGKNPFNQETSTLSERVEIIRGVAIKENVCLCDVYGVWIEFLEKGYNVEDMLANKINHPSKAGHEVYAMELMKLFE